MRIGITGSRGFIGTHLTEVLKEKRGVKLFTFDLPDRDLLGQKSLKNFVKGQDIIIHVAAVNRGSNASIIVGSIIATYNLVWAMRQYKSRAKLIYLSSIQAETDTVYGLSKKLTEIMLQDFSREYRIPVTIFRLTNVFGEGCKPFYNSVIATFCYQSVHNKPFIVTDGKKRMKFVYIEDVVCLILKEISTRRKKLFHFKRVVSGNKISILKLVKLIQSFKDLKNPAKLKFEKDLYKTYLSYAKNG